MIFRDLSNATFRFSLRPPGAEIMGGVQTPPPPPSRRWKIQRPSRERVKAKYEYYEIIVEYRNERFAGGPVTYLEAHAMRGAHIVDCGYYLGEFLDTPMVHNHQR